tara:strand:- start:34517 stop:36007 length:1491 start_codon:yes stop_codon:yes gene_type:complete
MTKAVDEPSAPSSRDDSSHEEARLRPLVVDIDGTLVRSDFFYECLLQSIKHKPWTLLALVFWFLRGKAYLKAKLYEHGGEYVSPDFLPYRPEVRRLIAQAVQAGRPIILASGSDARFVESVAKHLELDGPHFGSSESINLTSSRKAERLVRAFPDGFDYIGNSSADIAVWKAASVRYGAGVSAGLEHHVISKGMTLERLTPPEKMLKPMIKALRLHQWAKNLLIFTIFAITYPAYGLGPLLETGIGFVLLGMVASGTYVINDLLDIEADRRHATKRERALASGELGALSAFGLALCLIVIAHFAAFFIAPLFCIVLASYCALTLLYSFKLKSLAVVDVFCLASLFSLRVIAGGAIIAVAPSPWLLSFMFFFFLSLALAKRVVELNRKRDTVPPAQWSETLAGRGYSVNDRDFVISGGLATAALSLNVFFIYSLLSNVTLFSSPWFAMLAGVVLAFWLLRMWYLAVRGDMHDDPIYFAVKDWLSVVLGAILLVLVIL